MSSTPKGTATGSARKWNKGNDEALLETGHRLHGDLWLTLERLIAWFRSMDISIRVDGQPSSVLTAIFENMADDLATHLTHFRSLLEAMAATTTLPDLEEDVWQQLKSSAGEREPLNAVFDVDFYIDTDNGDVISQVKDSLRAVFESIQAEVLVEAPDILSSWRKRLAATVKQSEALATAAEALKAAMVNLPQAQANSENSEAVARLIDSIGSAPNAVLRFGPVLVVKVTVEDETAVVTTDLSHEQQRALTRHPDWLIEPKLLLGRLSKAAEDAASRPALRGESSGADDSGGAAAAARK
jgi:hypothetical protein